MAAAHKNVEEITVGVKGNLEKLVVNNENISDLEDQSAKMRDTADQFKKQSKSLERTLWWKNIKLYVYLGIGIIAVIVLIVLLSKIF